MERLYKAGVCVFSLFLLDPECHYGTYLKHRIIYLSNFQKVYIPMRFNLEFSYDSFLDGCYFFVFMSLLVCLCKIVFLYVCLLFRYMLLIFSR